ncbi:MAG: YegS/Rv2252/BmrU family lipid kinase [Candidatus Lokiarchaeota archaeon]|nr:YegS/Rv2252/BmrU family lipid kinase [Candidatus Lokiarchaeota archaeon]
MFIIINPKSGNGKTEKRWKNIIQPLLDSKDFKYEFEITEYQNHATEIARERVKAGEDYIVAVGGDGTFNEVVNGFFENNELINPDVILGLVSSGTGSDTIKTLGHSKEFEDAVDILKNGIDKKVDIGLARYKNFEGEPESRYFINVGDVGLGGDVVDRVNKTTKIFGGKVSFLIGAIRGILHHKKVNSKIIIGEKEDQEYECDLNLVAVGIGQYFGGGMWICPNAINDDGLFDIVTIQDAGRWKLLTNIGKIYDGKHLEMPEAKEHPRAKRVKVEAQEPLFLDLDGEQVGTTDVEFTIIPQAVLIKTIKENQTNID